MGSHFFAAVAFYDFFGDELRQPVIVLRFGQAVFEVFFVVVSSKNARRLQIDELFHRFRIARGRHDVSRTFDIGRPSVRLVVFAERDPRHRGEVDHGVGPGFLYESLHALRVSDVHLLPVGVDRIRKNVLARFSEPSGSSGYEDFAKILPIHFLEVVNRQGILRASACRGFLDGSSTGRCSYIWGLSSFGILRRFFQGCCLRARRF